MPRKLFGPRLRQLRQNRQLTLADLAGAIECSVVYVSDIERSRRNPPSPWKIEVMLNAMGEEGRLHEMLCLAAEARRSVVISVDSKSRGITEMLVTLADLIDRARLTEEVAEKVRGLLGGGSERDGKCIRCGECCRKGGRCIVREWVQLPVEFEGVCRLLANDNLCDGLRDRGGEWWWDSFMPGHCSKSLGG